MKTYGDSERGAYKGWIVAKGLKPFSIMTAIKSRQHLADLGTGGNERVNTMSFPSKATTGGRNCAAVELSLDMIESLQEALKKKRRQLEDIQSRMQSLIQEYEQLNATATGMAEQFSDVMRGLDPDNSASGDRGQRKCA